MGPVSRDEAAGVYADAMLPKSPVVCKPFEEAFEQAFKILNINSLRTVRDMTLPFRTTHFTFDSLVKCGLYL